MSVVAVTEPEYYKAEEIFSDFDGFQCIPVSNREAELAEAIRTCRARHVIVGVDKYENLLYEQLSPRGVIARFGVGYDGIDLQKATRAGLLCTNTPHVLVDSVAEFTLALILAAARKIVTLATDCRAGIWKPKVGYELRDKILAIIGCGPIGCRVAQMAAWGFHMKVFGCEIGDVDAKKMAKEYGFTAITKNFDKAVAEADYVSLHIPGNKMTRHFINQDRINKIPEKAWLINTARGVIIDEKALYDALECGRLAGAALDVFEAEPYVPASSDRDLRKLDNIIMTPHTASSSRESAFRIAERCLLNFAYAEAGEYHRMDLLNPKVLQNKSLAKR